MTQPPLHRPEGRRRSSSRGLVAIAGLSVLLPRVPWTSPLVPLAALADVQAGTIVTYAGGGVEDQGPAVDAVLVQPGKLAFDAAGDLLICDPGASRVRVVHNGIVSTFAGTGDRGTTGDGGDARQAQIGVPSGIAVGPDHHVYISDAWNGRVRAVDSHGVITTFASNLVAPAGLAFDHGGNLYVAERGLNRVIRLGASGGTPMPFAGTGVPTYDGDGVPALAAALDAPQDVAVDGAGDVYIADTGNNRVRKVDGSGVISTVLPVPSVASEYVAADASAVNAPQALTLDGRGNVFVADTQNLRVAEISGAIASTYESFGPPASGRPAYQAEHAVSGVAFGPDGDIYATSGYSVYRSVHEYAVAGEALRFNNGADGGGAFFPAPVPGYWTPAPVDTADGRPATDAHLALQLGSIALDPAGRLVVPTETVVRRVSATGTIATLAGTGQQGTNSDWGYGKGYGHQNQPALSADVYPLSVATDGTGDVYFGDWLSSKVIEIDGHGLLHDITGGIGGGGGSGGGSARPTHGPAATVRLNQPSALLVAPDGDLYIADTGGGVGGVVLRVSHGNVTLVAGRDPDSGSQSNGDVVCNAEDASKTGTNSNGGEAYSYADSVYAQNGDGGPATDACLTGPTGLALDGAGNLYIADPGENRVRRVDTGGIISTVAGTGAPGYTPDGAPAAEANLDSPGGVAVDAAGNLFIADTANHVVRRVDHANGTLTTVAGSAAAGQQVGVTGYADQWLRLTSAQQEADLVDENQPTPARGDGGAATGAFLAVPWALAFDGRGDLFVSDPGDGRVREVHGVGDMHHTAGPVASTGATWSSCPAAVDRAAEDAHILAPHSAAPEAMLRRADVRAACGRNTVAATHRASPAAVFAPLRRSRW